MNMKHKNNYNNNNKRDYKNGNSGNNKYNNNNGSNSGNYNNHRRGQDVKNDKKGPQRPSSENTLSFIKNPSGFLIVSLFVPAKSSFLAVSNTIDSVLKVDHKKKIVISFEDPTDKSLIASMKKKFEGAFGIFFLNQKGNASLQNSSNLHTEVLNAFKSSFFLTLTAGVVMREFALEKMILFLCKPTDTVAVIPKFYKSDDKTIVQNCRRFFSPISVFKSNRSLEHYMMERGEVGYYSIHRVDYSSLDCMLFLTEALLLCKKIPAIKNTEVRNAIFCRRFAKKTKGKIMFYPHSRVVSSSVESEVIPFFDKLKYSLRSIF